VTEPIAVDVQGNGLEQISFSGRPLSARSPLQLKELLTGNKANPLVQLRSVRDSTLNELNALFKQSGTKEQIANGMFGATPIGGVARVDTHIAAAKTLGVALGIDAAQLDRDFTDNGRVKAVPVGEG
jgi:hypothetical protein